MIKRIAIAALAAVLVVLLVLPPVFGARARALVEDRLATASEFAPAEIDLDVEFVDWRTGWFSSTGTVNLRAKITPGPGDLTGALSDVTEELDVTLAEAVTLHHGPVMYRSSDVGWGGFLFELDESAVAELAAIQDGLDVDYVARLAIAVGFFGKTALRVDMPAFEYHGDAFGAGPVDFEFGGLDATAIVEGRSARLDGGLPRTSFEVPNAIRIVVDGTTWTGQFRRDDRFPNLPLGGLNSRVAHIGVWGMPDPPGISFEMEELTATNHSAVEGDHFVSGAEFGAEVVRVAGRELDELKLGMEVLFDAEGFDEVIRLDAVPADDPRFEEAVASLMKTQARISIDPVAFSHEEMPASASLVAEYRGDELPEYLVLGVDTDPSVVMEALAAELEVAVHRNLLAALGLGDVDSLIRVLVQEGLVLETDDTYTLNVLFESGQLDLNGEPVDPLQLMGLLTSL